MTRLLAILVLALSTGAKASTLPFSLISCGDHWFEVHAAIDSDGRGADVWFTGDSRPDLAAYRAVVVEDGADIILTIVEKSTWFVIDASDAVNGRYWGAFVQGEIVDELGLCFTR